MFAHGDAQLRTMDQNRAEGITSDDAIQTFIRDSSIWSKTTGKPVSPMKESTPADPNTNPASGAASAGSEPETFFPPPEYGSEPATWARTSNSEPTFPNAETDPASIVLPRNVTFDMDDMIIHRYREVNSVESTHLRPSSSHECCGNSANSSLGSDPAEERHLAAGDGALEGFSLIRGQSGYLLFEPDGRYRHNPYAW